MKQRLKFKGLSIAAALVLFLVFCSCVVFTKQIFVQQTTRATSTNAMPVAVAMASPATVKIPARPKPQRPELSPVPAPAFDDSRYLELADRAGWAGAKEMADALNATHTNAVKRREFEEWLIDHEMQIYSAAKVQAYLEAQAAKLNSQSEFTRYYVDWFPLEGREYTNCSNVAADTAVTLAGNIAQCASVSGKVNYTKPIPKFALEEMAEIRDAFPDAKFEVSDIVGIKDPFLRVNFSWGSEIIARWDEPSFVP